MARVMVVKCEACDRVIQHDDPTRKTGWLLEDTAQDLRTQPLDFCTLKCLARWLAHPDVQRFYQLDWEVDPLAAKRAAIDSQADGAVNEPPLIVSAKD